MKENRPCEHFDEQTLLFYIGYNKDGLRGAAKSEYKRRYGVDYVAELEESGWLPGVEEGRSGYFDPETGAHYFPEAAIAINTMRHRKSRFAREPKPL